MSGGHDPLSDLRLADVLTFLAVRRCGSITGAARELKVTPSQVSKAIARLEEQLQVSLLNRGARGVALSDAGRRTIPHLEDLIARLRLLRRSDGDESAELTFAAPSYLITLFLPRIAEGQPQLRVRGLELPPALIRAFAAENFFDLTLTIGMERLPGTWVSLRVGEVRKGLFCAPAVARQLGPQPIAPERLADLPFISPIYSLNGQFVPADDGCPLAHGDRKLGHEAQTIGLALELAARTGQLVFGPAVAASGHVDRGVLEEVRVRGWSVSESLYLACNADRVLARQQKEIATLLGAALESLGAAAG
jgi:DNA-binding transcriptional LysR family regulator